MKSGQLASMEGRNRNCSRRDAKGCFVNLECATSTTIERSRFLQDRLRECSGAGCMNSKLRCPEKYRELMSIAVALATRCGYRIDAHVQTPSKPAPLPQQAP